MKAYVRPEMMIETFMADEFVSACGDVDRDYLFECNGGEKSKKYDVVTDSDINLTEDDRMVWGYSPCDEEHRTENVGEFMYGHLYETGGYDEDIRPSTKGDRVVIWWEGTKRGVHCSGQLQDFSQIINRS